MIDEIDEGQALDAARAAALRLIERQPRTRRNLERRLAEGGHARGAIAEILDRFETVGLIDDRLYAEGFIRRRLRLRPRPSALLRRELKAREVSGAAIEAALEAFAGELDEAALARAVLDRRRSGWARLEPAVRRRRAAQTLRRLGFSAAAIAEGVRSLK